MSRPRLSASPYVLHARGGIIDKLGAADGRLDSVELGDWREGKALYALGIEFGLEFGPAYRQLSRARRAGGMIEVRLSAHSGDARYGLDPARLDSCFHGLILLFEDLGRERIAYLPVRFDEIQLIKPGAQLAQARLRIRRADEREIVADYELFDDRGQRDCEAVRRPLSTGPLEARGDSLAGRTCRKLDSCDRKTRRGGACARSRVQRRASVCAAGRTAR